MLSSCSGAPDRARGASVDTHTSSTTSTTSAPATSAPATTVSPTELTSCARTLQPSFRFLPPFDGLPVPPADEGESLTYEGTFRDPDEDGVVVVNRADGVVTFARTGDTEPGPYKFHDYVHQVFPTIDVGDLNGDGNPDYAIAAEEGPYFISGTVPPGTHDPRDV